VVTEMSLRTVMAAGLMLVCVGCHGPHEVSVNPGINDKYKNELKVDEWVKRFESESREVNVHREAIVHDVGLNPGAVVADVGAGTGLFTAPLAKAVGPSGKVFAVDIAKNFLDHIAAQAKAKGLGNVETVLCKDDSVELPAGSIDVAFLCDAYHHFEYPKSTMKSIHRALRPGGVLVVIDFERIPGQSRKWVIGHVRANKEQVTAEIRSCGFEPADDPPAASYLKENYLLRFRKVN